ncbi:MAG: hypothetical protein O2958_11505 [Gemmatimonadetes bacterium]|nr:hypothetical protein [Gemmatimonadota bacterium]MDA1104818.1 hypothetical protein [Gemmatimonadota bacterium]
MAGVIAVALIAIVPPVTLVPVSSMGAIFGSVSGSWFLRTQQRSAEAEPYRPYRLDPDLSISAAEAGELLHLLSFVGRTGDVDEPMLAPVRTYDAEWISASESDVRTDIPPFWTDSVWSWVGRGLTREETRFLEQVAAHPAHIDFSRLARAGALDAIGGRYKLPFSADQIFWQLPIPKLTSVRTGATSHLSIAALHSAAGRHALAEQSTREVISVGFLLMDEAPTIIEHLVGASVVGFGGEALREVLRLGGDSARAEALEGAVLAAERASARMAAGRGKRPGAQAFLESLPSVIDDEDAIRGIRWEYVSIATGLTPCLNLQNVVFGPADEFTSWLEGVENSLVRYDAEAALFGVATRGFVPNEVEAGFLARLLTMSMGGMETQGSCARLIATLPMIM